MFELFLAITWTGTFLVSIATVIQGIRFNRKYPEIQFPLSRPAIIMGIVSVVMTAYCWNKYLITLTVSV